MKFFIQLFQNDRSWTTGRQWHFRIVEFVLVIQLIYYAWSWGYYIQHLSAVVLPLGLANYMDVSVFFHHNYSLILALLATATALLGFFRVYRWSYAVTILLFHLIYISRFSQGEISHGANMLGVSILSIAIATMSFANEKEVQKFTWGLIVFLVGFSYTSAAFCKLFGTGLNWANGSHLWLWMHELATDRLSENGAFSFNFLQKLLFQHHWMATTILMSGWIVEFLGFTFWINKLRPFITTLLIGMHVGIYLSMRINFVDNFAFMLIMIGYPWDHLIHHIREKYADTFKGLKSSRILYPFGSQH